MMTSFRERELDTACYAAVTTIILDPVINNTPTWLISHVPHVDATLGIAHIQALVISTSSSSLSSSLLTTTLPPTGVIRHCLSLQQFAIIHYSCKVTHHLQTRTEDICTPFKLCLPRLISFIYSSNTS